LQKKKQLWRSILRQSNIKDEIKKKTKKNNQSDPRHPKLECQTRDMDSEAIKTQSRERKKLQCPISNNLNVEGWNEKKSTKNCQAHDLGLEIKINP
jgi:hypothetical protein